MNKNFVFIVFLFIGALLITPFLVSADGMLIQPSPYGDGWDHPDEDNQQVFINYENGLEKMILTIGIKDQNQKGAVWIFPVPAEPEKVVIDVLTKTPNLTGQEIFIEAKENLDDVKELLNSTQIYPMVYYMIKSYFGMSESMGISSDLGGRLGGKEDNKRITDVVVYEHLEKEGIVSEIITAKTSTGLFVYLKGKGLNIDKDSIPVLNKYIGKNFSFVVSWLNLETPAISAEEIKNNLGIDFNKTTNYREKNLQKGIFVTFPTKDIYFPLMPTSVYGSKVVPATIKIIGYVSPKVFKDIKNYTQTEYFIEDYYNSDPDLNNFYKYNSFKSDFVRYTKITINAPSKLLTDDLWIENYAPFTTYIADFIIQHSYIIGFILLFFVSIMAGSLSAWLVFKEYRNYKDAFNFGLNGIYNCLSIIGVIIAVSLRKTAVIKEEDRPLFEELKAKGYHIASGDALRKLLFVLCFSFAFLSILWVLVEFIKIIL